MPERIELTPSQRRRCNRLIKRLCANYDDGNCLLLDDGEPCVCPQTISYSLLCRYFRNAVLPADKELYADIFKQRTYRCAECGAVFTPNSNRQKYCTVCGKRIHRKRTQTEKWNVRHRKSLKNQGLQPPIWGNAYQIPRSLKIGG